MKPIKRDNTMFATLKARYRFAAHWAAGRILDCACGSGYGSNLLAQRGFEVVGADCDTRAIEMARTAHPELDFYLADEASSLPFAGGSFDTCISLTSEHIDDEASYIAELARVVRTGGRLVYAIPTRHYNEPDYTLNGALELVTKSFCVQLFSGQDFQRPGWFGRITEALGWRRHDYTVLTWIPEDMWEWPWEWLPSQVILCGTKA